MSSECRAKLRPGRLAGAGTARAEGRPDVVRVAMSCLHRGVKFGAVGGQCHERLLKGCVSRSKQLQQYAVAVRDFPYLCDLQAAYLQVTVGTGLDGAAR